MQERYSEASRRLEADVSRMLRLPKGTQQFTEADRRELEATLGAELDAHLQIETAYLFSRILLDQIADSIS